MNMADVKPIGGIVLSRAGWALLQPARRRQATRRRAAAGLGAVVMLLTALLALNQVIHAAEPLPYGHQDFVPTPEKPIYFRAGNGEYPGATPPAEWWEGTPVQRDGKEQDRFDKSKMNPVKIWDFADDKSKNILWKVPVPGWGLSHPIVVGKRVFAVGHPDFVTCWDFDTGKQLWQHRVNPLVLAGLPEDKALAGQKVLDLARALSYVFRGRRGDIYKAPSDKDAEAFLAKWHTLSGKLVKMLVAHRPDVEAFGNANLLKAVDEDLALLRAYDATKDLTAWETLTSEHASRHGDRPHKLSYACFRELRITTGGAEAWMGYVGCADSTLASDGQRIYGVFSQGQVFCYDLDGNVLWGHQEKGNSGNNCNFHRSPLLCENLLIVSNIGKSNEQQTGWSFRALDTQTGQLRWETPLPKSNYTVPRLMRLTVQGGAAMDVLIGDAPEDKVKNLGLPILRVSDGKVIGHFPYQNCGRGAVMSIWGDLVTWGSTSDGGGGPSACYRVRLADPGSATAEPVWVQEGTDRIFPNNAGFPSTLDGLRIGEFSTKVKKGGSSVCDVTSGKEIALLPRVSSQIVAGKYLIGFISQDAPPMKHRSFRDDCKAMARMAVVDLSAPTKPKVLSDHNLLGYKDPPADIILKNYLSDFDWDDFTSSGYGSASYFSLMGGVVPHGDRLLIQSTAFLYCIGEK